MQACRSAGTAALAAQQALPQFAEPVEQCSVGRMAIDGLFFLVQPEREWDGQQVHRYVDLIRAATSRE